MNRPTKRQSLLSLAAVLLLLGAGLWFHETQQQKRYEAEFIDVFDTMTKLAGYAKSEKEFQAQADFIHHELREYHRLFDIYNEYEGLNNLKTVNDNAGIAPVKVDRRILDLLEFSKEIYTLSEGKVNIAFGSVLSLWHQYREEGIEDPARAELPPQEDLNRAAAHTDMGDMVIDRENSTVYLTDGEMRLDVGAVAKGFAVEAVSREARREGLVDSMLISVGGNIRAVGYRKDAGKLWRVGVQNPDESGDMLETVEMADSALVTSGDYQRSYTVDGKAYHHIIDPATLMPAEHYHAVTVFCQDSGLADGLSTAVFLLDYDESSALIRSIDGAGALYVMMDGSLRRVGKKF